MSYRRNTQSVRKPSVCTSTEKADCNFKNQGIEESTRSLSRFQNIAGSEIIIYSGSFSRQQKSSTSTKSNSIKDDLTRILQAEIFRSELFCTS